MMCRMCRKPDTNAPVHVLCCCWIAAGHASGNPKTAEIEHLLVPGIVPGSLVGIKDIDSLEPEAEAL